MTIGEVQLNERESFTRPELCQSSFLQSDVVVIVEIVEADDMVASVQEAHRHMESDESRGSGDKNRRWSFAHSCSSK